MATTAKKTFITNKNLYALLPRPGTELIEVTLAILNSRLISRLYIEAVSQATKDDFPQVTITDLMALPVPTHIPEQARNRLVTLVAQVLEAKQSDPDAEANKLEREIDQQVYALYGLTPEEIKIVEAASK